jgi:hypothetical protein
LALLKGEGGAMIPAHILAKYTASPAATTLYRWLEEENLPKLSSPGSLSAGRPPLLTQDQLDIIGGFVLFCDYSHQCCSIKEVEDFVNTAFGINLSPAFISQHLHLLGFSSHRPSSLKFTYGGIDIAMAAVDFLRTHQAMLKNVSPRSRLLAVDQISFWECGVITSSYSPIGG